MCFQSYLQDAEATAQLSQFFEQRRHDQDQAGKLLRRFKHAQKQGEKAKAEAAQAAQELKLKRRAFAAEQEDRRRTEEQLKALKYFDPKMLGQGLPGGGGEAHPDRDAPRACRTETVAYRDRDAARP